VSATWPQHVARLKGSVTKHTVGESVGMCGSETPAMLLLQRLFPCGCLASGVVTQHFVNWKPSSKMARGGCACHTVLHSLMAAGKNTLAILRFRSDE